MSTLDNCKSHVLIVDDDIITAQLFYEIISDLDINVIIANSGKEALQKANGKDFSVVLLDIKMPNMDGFEVLQEFRKIKGFELTPVIFISANFTDQDIIEKAFNSGAIDFIPKPVNHKILRQKVYQFVKLDQYRQGNETLIKQLEESTYKAKENENRFKKISNAANDSIIVLNEEFKIKFWNRAARLVFGYSRVEIRDENIFDYIIAPEEKEKLKTKLHNIINAEKDVVNTEEIKVVHKLGYKFITEMSFSYFKSRPGSLNIVVVARDISLRKKLEKNMLKAKELMEANKTMKEFVDNVSHHLRTPMNAILGISKMLLKYNSENLSSKQNEGLNIIRNNGEKLLELINDVLDLSKLESGKTEVVNEIFSLEKLLSNIRSIILNLIDSKDIKFVIKKSNNVPDLIYSDQKKLTQILVNLLGNSAKFTEKGKIVVSIHLKEKSLFFEIFDTGCGIPEDKINYIFDRFAQADNSNSKSYEGTGLGLFIVKKMIDLMMGGIKIESIENQETTIIFNIPFKGIDENSKHKTSESTKQLKKHNLNLSIASNEKKLLALIIEDNQSVSILYRSWLEQMGYSILIAENGIDGYHALETYLPDLVIISMEVKRFSAFKILNNIINKPELFETRVIAISSKMNTINSKLLNETSSFLTEPVSEEILVETIRKINPIVKKQQTPLTVINDNKIEHQIQFTDLDFVYDFNNTTVEESMFLILRRKSKILILKGIGNNTLNHQLLNMLEKEKAQFENCQIIIVGTNYDNPQLNIRKSEKVIEVPNSFFKAPMRFADLTKLIKTKNNA